MRNVAASFVTLAPSDRFFPSGTLGPVRQATRRPVIGGVMLGFGMHTAGASHVSFSVRDLERSLAWYREVFGADVMFHEPGEDRSAAVLSLPGTSLLIGLTQFESRPDDAFDPTRTGLDHFAFAVESLAALEQWAELLDSHEIEHSGPIEVPPGAILNFKDPDGIALALMWRR